MINFEIKPADLILVRGTEGAAFIIESLTQSPYSHVAGLVKPNELIEAQTFRKTGYQGLDIYDGCSDVFTCDQLTDDQRHQIVKFVTDQVGTGYSYRLLGWELEHYILHIDSNFVPNGKYDCSTLWCEAYRSVGIDPCPGIRFATPGDLGRSVAFRKAGSI